MRIQYSLNYFYWFRLLLSRVLFLCYTSGYCLDFIWITPLAISTFLCENNQHCEAYIQYMLSFDLNVSSASGKRIVLESARVFLTEF